MGFVSDDHLVDTMHYTFILYSIMHDGQWDDMHI